MQHTAKIIRHRHKFHHYINDDLKKVEEEVHFKIVFSSPDEFVKFEKWIEAAGGRYEYDKENSVQLGEMPERIEAKFPIEVCWCDIQSYYLLHVAGYTFHSTIHPYKGEVYLKDVNTAEDLGPGF